MLFMNDFLQQHWDGMRTFLQTVSSLDSEMPTTSFDGYVDLPLRLAVLHGLLVDIIYQRDQVGQQPVQIPPQHLCDSQVLASTGSTGKHAPAVGHLVFALF